MPFGLYMARFWPAISSAGLCLETLRRVARLCFEYPSLPDDWRETQFNGYRYYYQRMDHRTTWEHPIDQIFACILARIAYPLETIRASVMTELFPALTDDISWLELAIQTIMKMLDAESAYRLGDEFFSCPSSPCLNVSTSPIHPRGGPNEHDDVTFASDQLGSIILSVDR